MKIYKKPTLEVISMKTSESIAADSFIKTVYVKAAQKQGYMFDSTASKVYDPDADINGSAYPRMNDSLQG